MIGCKNFGRLLISHKIGVKYNNNRIHANTNFLVSRANIFNTDVVIDKEIEKSIAHNK